MILLGESVVLITMAALLAKVARRAGLPPLLGMIVGGMLFGFWNPWAESSGLRLEQLSGELRYMVLALVLLRAGLNLSARELQDSGSLAFRLGSIPIFFEAFVIAFASHWILGLPLPVGAVLGFVVAPISPAIVIPGLLALHGPSTGRSRKVVTALLVGAPMDNILAIMWLGIALDVALAGDVSWRGHMAFVPQSILGGVALGVLLGLLLSRMFRFWLASDRHRRVGIAEGVVLWSVAWGVVALGRFLDLSFVLALITVGAIIREKLPEFWEALSAILAKAWSVAQYLLFALIGAAVNLEPLAAVGVVAVLLIFLGQAGRAGGVAFATARSGLNGREKTACVLSYVPKATIQAALAALPLDRGMESGELVLSVAVLAIAITAPLGAITLLKGARSLLEIPPSDHHLDKLE